MNVYFSELEITELENMSVKEARAIWNNCFKANYPIVIAVRMIMLGLGLIPVLYFNLHGLSIFCAVLVASYSWQPILIALLRPKIRQQMESQNPA